MAIPQNAVLDNFNRANGALGANWTTAGGGPPTVNTNAAQVSVIGGGGGNARWDASGPFTDAECYYTITSPAISTGGGVLFSAYAGLSSPGAISFTDYYQFQIPTSNFSGDINSNAVTLSRAGSLPWSVTVFAANVLATGIVNLTGVGMMLRVVGHAEGQQVQGWLKPVGGTWIRVWAENERTRTGQSQLSGRIGFGMSHPNQTVTLKIDDFGGGALTGVNYGLADVPTLTGVLPDPLAAPLAPMEGFHEGNVAGVLPDQLAGRISASNVHGSTRVREGGGGKIGVL